MLGELDKANISNLLVAATDVLYAEGNIFDFAYMEIRSVEGEMRFITDIRDENGQVRPGSVLEIRPM